MTKEYYADGHNREDVTEYRDDVFLPQMLEFERRMEDYTGDDMSVVIGPELLDAEKRVVIITHDASTVKESLCYGWRTGRANYS